MDNERQRLKDFLEEHIPFDELKKVGYWPKGTRRTDYEAIAARVCDRLGLKSIYDYDTIGEVYQDPEGRFVNGKFQDKVNEKGDFVQGGGFHLSLGQRQEEFDCPACTCHQKVRDNNKPAFTQTCKGCKRKLHFSSGYNGELYISESKSIPSSR